MKQNYHIIGVMSGTSLDGVDLAYLEFENINNQYFFKILKAETKPYSDFWLQTLSEAIHYSDEKLAQTNQDYTQYLGSIIADFITENNIETIDAVCSHGHTIKHEPQNGYTLQIGNLPEIARYVQQKVVCNFRVQDVKLGGQGAPLVPMGDKILFSDYDACINLGGFSNISFDIKNTRIAFDMCPVNTILNFYSQKINQPFDNQGVIARSGTLNLELFNALNQLDFYKKSYPKSLGVEFNSRFIFPIIDSFKESIENILHTFVEHCAFQIAHALPNPEVKVLLTGGGAYHLYLVERIQKYVPKATLVIPDNYTIQYKEALIFGLLGVLKLEGKNNVLASVTGAKHDHCAGEVYEF